MFLGVGDMMWEGGPHHHLSGWHLYIYIWPYKWYNPTYNYRDYRGHNSIYNSIWHWKVVAGPMLVFHRESVTWRIIPFDKWLTNMVARWWQLKYFFNFHPGSLWGNDSI